jgi:hypothetical protein
MTKRQVQKLKFRERLHKQAIATENDIMHSYLLETKKDNLRFWQK